ncbi:MAG: hypothetical protein HKO62_11595 [Gammaproteobacteria bacterium]|nr:hypothetical protein [Gammaproteobacteria bacterium]
MLLAGLAGLAGASIADDDGGDTLAAAITGGDFALTARYRYESVDDAALSAGGTPLRDAEASTIRITLGYETAAWHGLALGAEVEHVSELGPDDFNNGSNGKTTFATVADPDGTEFNEAYIKYSGLDNTVVKLGRQIITYRKAPLHRFAGTVLWRQNWQTHDALTVTSTPDENLAIRYAYIWNVNRIFGDDAPAPLSNFDSNSHLVNITFDGLPRLKLEGYAYLLDLGNADGFSSQTYGLRGTGSLPLGAGPELLYAAEYAHQADYADNPADIDANYYLLQGGLKFTRLPVLSTLTFKLTHEVLGGDGGADRFVTIFGTNHAFQGTADRFLVTPGDGIKDSYLDVVGTVDKLKFVVSWHMLESDRDSYDYGDELDLQVQYTFRKRYTLALKYADYEADRNALNIARNPAQSADKSIFWAFASVRFP